MDDFKKIFEDKRILVTGGTGSIGSEIVRQLLNYEPKQIRIYSRDESKQFFLQQELDSDKHKEILRFLIGDVRDKDRLDRAFNDIDIVFHAAALKHVPFCEDNPFEAVKTNIQGTQNVLDLAIDHKVKKVIAISSDKAVYPNTVMGISKLMMERLVVSAANYSGDPGIKFSVVRFGNVINSRGSVIPLWIEQVKKGKSVTVTSEKMERFFMRIEDAVDLVFIAATMMLGQEIFVLKMPNFNILKLAKEVIKIHGNGREVDIKFIGAREREKMQERLYTDEEKEFMIDTGIFNVVMPNKEIYRERLSSYTMGRDIKMVGNQEVLRSIEDIG